MEQEERYENEVEEETENEFDEEPEQSNDGILDILGFGKGFSMDSIFDSSLMNFDY